MNYIDKKFLLNKSKVFCIIPFIHVNTTPSGAAYPCCISAAGPAMGNTNKQSIKEIVNSPGMNALRTDMLSETANHICNVCYQHEENGVRSFRIGSNKQYEHYFDEDVLENVQPDGSLNDFRMRYFDIRFSNICNFKCRTCGPEFSSQWEQETKVNFPNKYRIIDDNRTPELIEEVKRHIPYMEVAYFAGGEPLITEEHYVLLEEMIRQKRNNLELRYNTNLSNLKFKSKDLLDLWKNFDRIYISASVDHYGKRAEYIRHGTNWEQQLENLRKVKALNYVDFSLNTVVSAFNYATIDEFYYYLMDNQLLTPNDHTFSLYNMMSPKHFAAHILPNDVKQETKKKLSKLYSHMIDCGFSNDQLKEVYLMSGWAESKDGWDLHKRKFRNEVRILDRIRGENFEEVFPELAHLMNEDNDES